MRWIVRLVGAVLLILVVAVVGVLMLPTERIARIGADQLSAMTGREVRLGGDLGLRFWPVLGVQVGELEIGNAPWAGDAPMLETQQAAIGVDAAALLRGEIRITQLEVQNPTVRLESRKDGRANWQFGAGEEAAGGGAGGTAPGLTVERVRITGASLRYAAEGAAPVTFDGVDLALDWPEPSGGAEIAATLRPAGAPVAVTAQVGGFSGFLTGQVQPVSLSVSADGGRVALDGRASLDGAVAGRLAVELADTGAFLAALGAAGVEMPDGLGRRVSLAGDMTLTPDARLALREMTADLGGNSLSGAADIDLAAKPRVNAQLVAGALDLRSVTGASEGGGAAPAGSGWPKDAIDASGLAAFDGAISLRADSIDLGTLRLGPTRVLMTNDRARMVFELREVRAYDGLLTGEFVMNNRNGLSVGGKLAAQGVALKPALTELAGITRFTGQGDAQVSFLGVGQNVDAIMRSLSGKGKVSVGRGTIEGIDLDDLLGSFDVQGGTTVFDQMSASFNMVEGVLSNQDLAMLLPNFEATGTGAVNLGGQRLDYTFTPKALRVNKDRGLAVPVRITGPWAAPKVRPDVSAAIDLNFREERARAEERVKQKVEEKLQEELGVVRQEGQSVEEAVKDRVEDKLKKELLKLFD